MAKALSVALFAGMVAGALGTFVLVVLWGALFVGERLDWVEGTTVSTILTNGRSVVTWLAVVLTVWAGGYGTTVRGSGPRIIAGLAVGLPIGMMMKALGSPAWTLAAVGIGWAVAIPARSIRMLGVRTVPFILLGLASVLLDASGPAAELGAGLGGVVVAEVVLLIMVGFVEPILLRRIDLVSRQGTTSDDSPTRSTEAEPSWEGPTEYQPKGED